MGEVEAGAKEVGATGVLDIASINSAAALSEVLRGCSRRSCGNRGILSHHEIGYIYIIYEEDEEVELSM